MTSCAVATLGVAVVAIIARSAAAIPAAPERLRRVVCLGPGGIQAPSSLACVSLIDDIERLSLIAYIAWMSPSEYNRMSKPRKTDTEGSAMQVRTTNELGLTVRQARRSLGWTQQELARAAGVGRQWIVAFEAGKPRVELGKVLQALAALSLSISVREAGWSEPSEADIGIAVPDTDAIVDAHRDPSS